MQPPDSPAAANERREGFLVGAVVGEALLAGAGGPDRPPAAPAGRRGAATALGDALLAELASGGVDLRRLAHRWTDWYGADGYGVDSLLGAALEHLRDFDAPIPELAAPSVAPLAAVLPAALASGSPRAMIAGAFHVSRMLDPRESTALAATAVVIAAAALLEGRVDFVPDVVAALRANDASDELIEAIRAIPRDPRAEPGRPSGESPDPVQVVTWVLWTVHHRPRSAAVLAESSLIGGLAPAVGAVLGALFGARDGISGWPAEWLERAGAVTGERRAFAARLGVT